jgi:hypothetical protein
MDELREVEKIRTYENNKKIVDIAIIISIVLFLIAEIIVFRAGIIDYEGYSKNQRNRYISRFIKETFLPTFSGMLFAVSWGLFVTRLMLHAICDHIIEMCYKNMQDREDKEQIHEEYENL